MNNPLSVRNELEYPPAAETTMEGGSDPAVKQILVSTRGSLTKAEYARRQHDLRNPHVKKPGAQRHR